MKSTFTFLLVILFLFNAANAQIRYLKGHLQSAQEVGLVNSPASGIVIVKYNTSTNFLELHGNYRSLSAAITASHIHGPAGPGVNAPVLIPLNNTGGTAGALSVTATLTDPQETDLIAGNMYVNVHTGTNPGGETRAQLTVTTDGQTELLEARLQGAQSTPPNGSAGTGSAYALVDKATDSLFLTATYTGLTTPASNAHIHFGATGVSGPVIVPVIFTTTTTGSLDTSRVISVTNRDNILAGNTYVNVHTGTYPAGEIRGQLTQLNDMWFFANAMQGSQQFPSNNSTARGTVIVKYNSQTNALDLVGDYQNLSAAITASHIHGPAGPGANAPVLFNLTNTGGTTGTLTGTATLTDAQEVDLLAGNMYTNVHNSLFPGGEIRAQLLVTAMGASHYFAGNLQASQSVATPAVVSSAMGTTTVLLDRVTNNVYVTGNFSGLTSNITATHIHGGAAGTNGPVVVPLFFGGTTAGTITGTATIRSTFADSMINGFSYINIHTGNFPAGEIRAQLGDIVLPVKLTLFNGYKDRQRIVLVWQSDEEINLSKYEIEQQNTGTSQWIFKATVPASGNMGSSNKYSLNDMPLAGSGNYVYYRLKMIDKDGRYTYSRVVRINYLQSKAELMLVSNPVVSEELRFIITGLAADKKAEISIVDFSGKLIANKLVSTMGENSISLRKLSSGVYKIIARVDDTVLQQTFMK